MDSAPDIQTVDAARGGDSRAMEAVLTYVQPILQAFFTSRTGRGAHVDDLVQNTLLRLHRGIKDLNEATSLKSFTMKAAVFELQDYYRGRYSIKEQLYDPGSMPDGQLEEPSEAAAIDVDRLLAQLTPKARRILELRAYGFKYEEIAGMIDSTEAAVKMQVRRALDKLKQFFVLLLAVGISSMGLSIK